MINYAPAPLANRAPPTQDDIAAKRRMALSLMQQGSDASPVGHWTQALARAFQGGIGGMTAAGASRDASSREAYDTQQSSAQRLAASEQEFQNKKRWDEYQRGREPTEAEKLDLESKRATINKMNREAAESGTTYGKSGSIFQGPDNKFYSIQFGGDGSRVILPLEVPGQGGQPSVSGPSQPQAPMPQEGAGRFAAPGMSTAQTPPMPLTPSRGVDVVGNQMYDKATGAPIRDVGGNLAEAERQKTLGEGQAKGELGLPKAKTALQDYEIKSRLVNDEIDRAISQAGPWTTGFVGNVASYVAGTPAHDLSKTLVGIQSNLGFDTLQQMRENSPTGGALGSVTERELELLQSTWGSLMQSQSEPQFRYHLNRLKEIKREYAVLKRQAYDADVARFGAGNVPNPNGASAGAASSGDGWTDVGGVRIREKR